MNRNRKIIERAGRSVISGLLITGLVLGNSGMIQAVEKVEKQETVYVTANAGGDVEDIVVSDWLKNSGINGEVQDSSQLKDIENVKGNEKFEQKGEDLTWKAGEDDIYYQGDTDKDLPVGLEITYKLDGKDISAEELKGKSGDVTMKVQYYNYAKVKRRVNGEITDLYVPFIMLTGMILPNDVFSEVEISKGRVINEGSNNLVLGYGMPGLKESLDLDEDDLNKKLTDSFEIKAKVTNFALKNTFTYASADFLAELDVDEDDLNDTFDDLDDKVGDLEKAADKLADGTGSLSDGMNTLKTQFKKYQKGEKSIHKGISQLSKGEKTMQNGIKTYVGGVNGFAKGTKAYVNGTDKIVKGNKQLYKSVKDMPDQYSEFSQGIKAYTSGVDQLADEKNTKQLTDGAESLANGVNALNENLQSLESSYENYTVLIAAMKQQTAQMTDPVQKATMNAYIDKLEELVKGQKSGVSAAVTATGQKSDLQKGAKALSAGVSKYVASVQAVSEKSSALRSGDTKMMEGMKQLVAGVKQLKEGGEKLTANDKKILQGAKKIIGAGSKIKKGNKKVLKGVNVLKKGSNQFNQATNQLGGGIGKLAKGSGQLEKGMDKFRDSGIHKIRDMFDDDILPMKERFLAIRDIAEEYNNYSGIKKGMDGTVKFIIETEEIGDDED